jgi:hypothetical protein
LYVIHSDSTCSTHFQKEAVLQGGCGYYYDNVLADIVSLRLAGEERQLCLHADNARVHPTQKCRDFCREDGLWSLPHLSYSHDLAPSDFFLFGHVKQSLAGMIFASRHELFEAILSVVMKIPIETLHRVFDHWLERLDLVAKNNGEYYPYSKYWLIYFLADSTGE